MVPGLSATAACRHAPRPRTWQQPQRVERERKQKALLLDGAESASKNTVRAPRWHSQPALRIARSMLAGAGKLRPNPTDSNVPCVRPERMPEVHNDHTPGASAQLSRCFPDAWSRSVTPRQPRTAPKLHCGIISRGGGYLQGRGQPSRPSAFRNSYQHMHASGGPTVAATPHLRHPSL